MRGFLYDFRRIEVHFGDEIRNVVLVKLQLGCEALGLWS